MRNSGWGSLGRTETEKWRAKGGVPQQPWHNTDVSLSLTLSLSLGPAWRGPMDPLLSRVPAPPTSALIPHKSCGSLTDVRMMASVAPPEWPRTKTNSRASSAASNDTLAYSSVFWKTRIPSLTTSKQWLSVHRLYFSSFALYDTTSWVWKYCDDASGRLQETTNI